MVLLDAIDTFTRWGAVRDGRLADINVGEDALRKGGHLQAALLKLAKAHIARPPALEIVIRPRVERWQRLGLFLSPPGVVCRRDGRILATIRKLCHPSVHWAVIRLWFNGWCTLRRFQSRRACSCLLCDTCGGEDSVEHYIHCPIVREVAAAKLRLTHFQHLLLLDVSFDDDAEVALSAAIVYAIYVTTNKLRAQKRRATEQEGRHLL